MLSPATTPHTPLATELDATYKRRRRFVENMKRFAKNPWASIKSLPHYFWTAVMVFVVLEAICIVGSFYFIQGQASQYKTASVSRAETAAAAIQGFVGKQVAPLTEIVNIIKTNPNYAVVNATFNKVAPLLDARYDFFSIAFSPQAYVTNIYVSQKPSLECRLSGNGCPSNLTGGNWTDFLVKNANLGQNLLSPPSPNSSRVATVTYAQYRSYMNCSTCAKDGISTLGPFFYPPAVAAAYSLSTTMITGTVIFLPDDGTWDLPIPPTPTVCPDSANLCLAPDGRRFWGTVNTRFRLGDLEFYLLKLTSENLLFSLTGGRGLISKSNATPFGAVSCVAVPLNGAETGYDGSGTEWLLCISSSTGTWTPTWGWALYFGVTLLSLMISLLIFFALRGRSRAILLQQLVHSELQKQIELNAKLEVLTVRQYQILEAFRNSKTSHSIHSSETSFESQIKVAREQLVAAGADKLSQDDKIETIKLIGQGAFGSVYLGRWRGSLVAIKRIFLPAGMSSSEKAQQMAVMEIAIASSMSHPNILQTYTYQLRPLEVELQLDCGGAFFSFSTVGGHSPTSGQMSYYSDVSTRALNQELLLVLEYCDRGALASLLKECGGLRNEGMLDISAILETAADVAKGMHHLHSHEILHCDIKADNVLLKSEGQSGRGFIAKVMDFGLSRQIDPNATHLSESRGGTPSFMAPELLMEGKATKMNDVYSYGVFLFELVSGTSPFKGMPAAALAHSVYFKHMRPRLPDDTPMFLREIIEKCWQPTPTQRPTFATLVKELNGFIEKHEPSKGIFKPSLQMRDAAEALQLTEATIPPAEASAINMSLGMPYIMINDKEGDKEEV